MGFDNLPRLKNRRRSMLATLFNLPKWLVALVALCILVGYTQQLRCKLDGYKLTVEAVKADTTKESGKSAPVSDENDCHCQCHLMTPSPADVPPSYVRFLRVAETDLPAWVDLMPDAPCMDIEHPPQLA